MLISQSNNNETWCVAILNGESYYEEYLTPLKTIDTIERGSRHPVLVSLNMQHVSFLSSLQTWNRESEFSPVQNSEEDEHAGGQRDEYLDVRNIANPISIYLRTFFMLIKWLDKGEFVRKKSSQSSFKIP